MLCAPVAGNRAHEMVEGFFPCPAFHVAAWEADSASEGGPEETGYPPRPTGTPQASLAAEASCPG